ncbi:lipocalin family protein [Flavobacterium sp.]|uniref:lipocalin family protein n=1 Tax=Flavobacterium sp. TaxID=239 RepID=UPI00263A16DF|nr:lipocalin family protein [Flavobacterium sp.]
MIKFKKLFLCSVLSIGLLSCSKDDDSNNAAAVALAGKWQFTKTGTINSNNQEVLTDYQHESGCTKDFIELTAAGVLKSHEFENPNCQETISTASYSRNNNTITITYPGDPAINGEILELTNTTLKVKFVSSGITDVDILTRIP